MEFKIEIQDEELKEHILTAAARSIFSDYSVDRNLYKRVISECVREVIYKDKAAIVDRIVAQASRECGNKAAKKLLEAMGHGSLHI